MNEIYKDDAGRDISPLIPPFWGYSNYTPTIPKLYWDVKSQEQRILNLFDLLNKLVCYSDTIANNVNANADEIKALQTELKNEVERIEIEFNELVDGNFWNYYEKQVEIWIKENMRGIIEDSIKQVYFGLNDDGYFVAYIPQSWSEIVFDTGAVYGRSDYGSLILRFDASGDGVIDNTYSYSLNALPHVHTCSTDGHVHKCSNKWEKLIADIELATRRTDSAFDTLFTNIDTEIHTKGADNV